MAKRGHDSAFGHDSENCPDSKKTRHEKPMCFSQNLAAAIQRFVNATYAEIAKKYVGTSLLKISLSHILKKFKKANIVFTGEQIHDGELPITTNVKPPEIVCSNVFNHPLFCNLDDRIFDFLAKYATIHFSLQYVDLSHEENYDGAEDALWRRLPGVVQFSDGHLNLSQALKKAENTKAVAMMVICRQHGITNDLMLMIHNIMQNM